MIFRLDLPSSSSAAPIIRRILQELTAVLSSRSINIQFARITKMENRVTTVFYVNGPSGEKILDENYLKELNQILQTCLDSATTYE